MWRRTKKILKIIGIVFLLLFLVLIVQFYRFSTPRSNLDIETEFIENKQSVYIKQLEFKNFEYRVITTQKEIDTTLPTLIFIHGSIGSALDFKQYLLDVELNKKANLISYDRIGYGIQQTGNVQESIAFETELLENLVTDLNLRNIILVGYSYGGPIALASNKTSYKKIILVAPAVYSKVEPMPWALNFYKWKVTRWMLPEIWKAASKEKLSHKKDLENFEHNWVANSSSILSIHGNEDWIVPISNSLYLKEKFLSQQFDLVTLEGAGHGLLWSKFSEIKNLILQQLN